MKIRRTWMAQRVKQTSWPRGQTAPPPSAGTAFSPVVAIVGIKGDRGEPAVPLDTGDLTLVFDNNLI